MSPLACKVNDLLMPLHIHRITQLPSLSACPVHPSSGNEILRQIEVVMSGIHILYFFGLIVGTVNVDVQSNVGV